MGNEKKKGSIRSEKPKQGFWKSLSEKKKLLIVCILVLFIVCLFVFFYLEFKRLNDITPIDESVYERLLNNLDDVKWYASKSGYKLLKGMNLLEENDYCITFSTEDEIIVEFDRIWASFYYDTGFIKGYINHTPALIFFSESILKTGRALTLVLDGNKIVFYQE